MMRAIKLAVACLAVVAATGPVQAGLIHQYRLDGSFADDFGGPSLVPAGGTLGPTRYTFGPNQGLSLSNALPDPASYSIELLFEFDATSGVRKILDPKNWTTDYGVYLDKKFPEDTGGEVKNLASLPGGTDAIWIDMGPPVNTGPNIPDAGDTRLVLTRDGTTVLAVVYVDGLRRITFTDDRNLLVLSGPDSIIQFFSDDFVTDQREASGGSVDLIRIYDAPLTDAEVALLEIPEPSSLPLVGLAAIAMAVGAARRPRREKQAV